MYSKEFIRIMELSLEEAETIVNYEPRVNLSREDGELRGFYARGSADLLNIRGCNGMCWYYYYFFNDHQYITTPPPAKGVDCTEDSCLNYEVRGDQLILDGHSHDFELTDHGMMLDGYHFNRHESLLRPKLDGTYVATSYTLINEADEALDLSTLKSKIWTPEIGVSDIPSLSPSPEDRLLAAGESVERTVVFLFPSDVLKEQTRFDLAFSELETESGSSALLDLELEFQLVSPY